MGDVRYDQFEVVGDPEALSDACIDALAALLLEISEPTDVDLPRETELV